MSEVLKMAIALISVLNPLGAIPTFLTLTSRNSDQEIRKISNTCSLAVFITLIVALFLGSHILDFFGITIASFRIGSGILFGGMAMNMMSAKPAQTKLSQDEVDSQLNVKEIGIVPLAIPMLSGPGAMSTIIVHAEHFKKPTHWVGAVLILL
ncbi:MAG: NAAT family transporter, partial [Bacteriovoracaceae bacterium]|nr:NAAT family transporter [Bacteriovoracaceae bacterium]